MKNKKGQTGETITWIVATVIIVVIILITVYVASVNYKNKGAGGNANFYTTADTLATKSFYSYLLTKDQSGKTVYTQLSGEGNLNDFNGLLAKKIFSAYYGKPGEYQYLWLGIMPGQIANNYFGARIQKDPSTLLSNNLKIDDKGNLSLELSKIAFSK